MLMRTILGMMPRIMRKAILDIDVNEDDTGDDAQDNEKGYTGH